MSFPWLGAVRGVCESVSWHSVHWDLSKESKGLWTRPQGWDLLELPVPQWQITGRQKNFKPEVLVQSHNFLPPSCSRELKQNPCPVTFGQRYTFRPSFLNMLPHALYDKWRLCCIGDNERQKNWILMLPPVSHNWFLYKIRNPEVTYDQLTQETTTLPVIPSCCSEEQKRTKGGFTSIKEELLAG